MGIPISYILGIITVFIPKISKKFTTSRKKSDTTVLPCPLYEDIGQESGIRQRNITFNMDQNSAYGDCAK